MSNSRNTYVASAVTSRAEARAVIAELIESWTTDEAFKRLSRAARVSKQTPREMAQRLASNLLSSFTTRRG